MKKRIGSPGSSRLQGSVGANRKNHWTFGDGRVAVAEQKQRGRERQRRNRRTTSAEGVQLSRPQNGRNWGTASLGGQNNLQAWPAEFHFKPPARCFDKHGVPREGEPLVATNLPPPGFVQGRGQRSANDKTLSDTPLAGAERRRLTPL